MIESVIVDLSCLGLIEGFHKRILEKHLAGVEFRQRKCYDEFYVVSSKLEVGTSLASLMELGHNFNVRLYPDIVEIGN